MCSTHPGKTVGETITVKCNKCTCPTSGVSHNWINKSETDRDTKQVWHTYQLCSMCNDTQNHQYFE
jgi:hypothetical protein